MNVQKTGLIIIPTYQPGMNLVGLVDELIALQSLSDNHDHSLGLVEILVINDGSTNKNSKTIFQQLADRDLVTVVAHPLNMGKGAALKTGFKYARDMHADFVLTADADGQHLPKDIIRLINVSDEDDKLILGVRTFDEDVPLRSRFGNILTRGIFKIIYRTAISDTQSGLRRIPAKFYKNFLLSEANGYEFELETLIQVSKQKAVVEVPIETVYEPGNPTSHFNPIFDSIQIYYVLFRGIISSLIVTGLDIAIFSLCVSLGASTFYAIAISRTIATLIYFTLGKKFIFRSDAPYFFEFIKFVSLVILNAIILTPVINYFAEHFDFNKTVVYAIGSAILFLFNFFVQKLVIFR